jgi:N-acetyl-anhydromuramoyl-L-alanine amidase
MLNNSPHERSSQPTTLWHGGWYAFARAIPSENFGPRPKDEPVNLLVIHSISLPPGQYGDNSVIEFFTNQLDTDAHPYFKSLQGMQVSAHFFVRRNGELIQFVGCDQRAWHAGTSSHRGRANCNDYSIGIELEGLEGDSFEHAQYETLTGLSAAIAQHYPIAEIAGHQHIAANRKADPGAGFNWLLLQDGLAWPAQCFPEPAGHAS